MELTTPTFTRGDFWFVQTHQIKLSIIQMAAQNDLEGWLNMLEQLRIQLAPQIRRTKIQAYSEEGMQKNFDEANELLKKIYTDQNQRNHYQYKVDLKRKLSEIQTNMNHVMSIHHLDFAKGKLRTAASMIKEALGVPEDEESQEEGEDAEEY